MDATYPTTPLPRGAREAGRRPSLSSLATVFAALLLVLGWTAVGMVLKSKRDDIIQATLQENDNLSAALTEQTLRVLAAIDQAMLRVAALKDDPGAAGDSLVRIANETGLTPGILVQLSLVDAQGRFLGSNIDPRARKSGPVDLSSRDHVRAHLGGLSAPSELFIGKPVLGKVSQRWTIQLSRRLMAPDGVTSGVVVASLDPSYFEDVFRRPMLGDTGGVTLVGADLAVRARVIGQRSVANDATLAPNSQFALEKGKGLGTYISSSSVDGTRRIFAFRRVADYPLYVVVSQGYDETLAEWAAIRNMVLALATGMTILAIGALLGFRTGVHRLEQANAALRVREAEAQAASQAKSEFLVAISHELRTPLTSIRGFAELMEHRLDQPRFREQAGLIRKGAEHLNNLLTEILDLTKVEAGAMTLVPQLTPLRPLVRGTADFFRLAAQAKRLELTSHVADDVPDMLECDTLRLKQILNNLLSNAVKFTAEGAVTLSVDQCGPELRFHVRDTGPGIAPELHETIFEKFRQGSAQVSTQHGGTGLGLALSRGLAELMAGRIELASAPGQGACFTLVLPVR